MLTYYAKRALEILTEDGFIQLGRIISKRGRNKLIGFRTYTRYNQLATYYNYDSPPPNPYKIIFIKPEIVRYKTPTGKSPTKSKQGLAQIINSDWDKLQYLDDVDSAWVVEGLKQRYKEGKDWENTRYYKEVKTLYKRGETKWSYPDFDTFCNNRLPYLDQMFHDISNNGYKPNYEEGHRIPFTDSSKFDNPVHKLEVLIYIGRDGRIIMAEGYHRFAIARILDLEIPVQVLARHKQWQELRDDIYNNGLSEEYEELRDHPDLQEVIDN